MGSTAPSVTSGYPGRDHSYQSRNGSNSSLRSRSTTTDSNSTLASASGRGQPPRFPAGGLPQQQAPLTLRTRELQQAAASPGDRGGDSYFSPTVDSPMSSSRTSSSSGAQYPFPAQQYPPGGPQNGYYQDGHGHTRYTAPAMNRPTMVGRGDTTPSVSNGYAPPGRNGPGPRAGYPSSGLHSAQNMPQQARNRSASSPDIHNAQRRQVSAGGPGAPPVPDVPLPYQNAQAAAHGASGPHIVPRSQSNSPSLPHGPPRHQSPQVPRDRNYPRQPSDPYDRTNQPTPSASYAPSSRSITPASSVRTAFSPPPAPTPSITNPYDPTSDSNSTPTQLKVKVNVADKNIPQILTLVVPISISYQSLKDRIEAKLQRSAPNCTLSFSGQGQAQAKLKYYDEGDYVSIQSDEDVVSAFESWRENVGEAGLGNGAGGMGEIELYCQR